MPVQDSNRYTKKAESFSKILSHLNQESLGLSGYQASYLSHLVDNLEYYLRIYSFALSEVSSSQTANLEKNVFLDYGCGNGMLGLFAKYCGYKTVVACDVDASSIDAAKMLSRALPVNIDHFIHGDINDVENYSTASGITPDVVIGTDVIEHIYDLSSFFRSLHKINDKQVNIFTTASNPENFFKIRALKKLQWRDEHTGGYRIHINGNVDHSSFEESYLSIRKRMIAEYANDLSPEQIDKLAICTRGMNKIDIEQAIDNYRLHGVLPGFDTHDLNTCDPASGSWSERLLPLTIYRKLYKEHGFTLDVKNGFYNEFSGGLVRKKFLATLNTIININQRSGRIIAPFIMFKGVGEQ